MTLRICAPDFLRRRFLYTVGTLAVAAGLSVSAGRASAQAAAAAAHTDATTPVVELTGRTLDGKPFDLRALRGRVVLLVAWATDCAVCRDKMPELRANAAGWREQAFSLLLLNMDPRRQDAADYESILARTLTPQQRLTALWVGDLNTPSPWVRREPLPATWLIDRQGRIVQHWTGRVPAEAWDRIADLL